MPRSVIIHGFKTHTDSVINARRIFAPFDRIKLRYGSDEERQRRLIFLQELENNPAIKEVCFDFSFYPPHSLTDLCDVIRNKSNLTCLDLHLHNSASMIYYEAIRDALANHPSLKVFWLAHYYSEDVQSQECTQIVISGIMANQHLHQITLLGYDFVADQLIELMEKKPLQYTSLAFEIRSAASTLTCKSWRNILQYNTSLTKLNIANFNGSISDKLCTYLSHALRFNQTLRSLTLGDDNITQRGINDIANMIHQNTTLQQLWLDVKNFSLDLKPIYNALVQSRSMQRIMLPFNAGISEELWLDLVQTNRLILSLQFFNCSLTSRGLKRIQEECRTNKKIASANVVILIHNFVQSFVWQLLPHEIWLDIFELLGYGPLLKKIIQFPY